MKEIVFLNKNISRWKNFESDLSSPRVTNPDSVADLFIQITDDLAYARTYYPNSDTERYLNFLAVKTHQVIYRNKREKLSRLVTFWTHEIPMIAAEYRRYIVYSLLIFVISVLIGIISSAKDRTFVRLIMGDRYVNMTIENINKEDPMAVYKQMNQVDMFLGITFNNVRVSFITFIYGIAFSIGTAMVLFYNGVMLGSFQYFFAEYGLLFESATTIWIHGTLEIWAIIVAGAAGMMMGNSILFPGTYPRITAFVNGATTGVKLIIGLVPFFIVAGFFEGFITRYTNAPLAIRLAIILGSLGFIVWYFFIYPQKLLRRVNKHINQEKK